MPSDNAPEIDDDLAYDQWCIIGAFTVSDKGDMFINPDGTPIPQRYYPLGENPDGTLKRERCRVVIIYQNPGNPYTIRHLDEMYVIPRIDRIYVKAVNLSDDIKRRMYPIRYWTIGVYPTKSGGDRATLYTSSRASIYSQHIEFVSNPR